MFSYYKQKSIIWTHSFHTSFCHCCRKHEECASSCWPVSFYCKSALIHMNCRGNPSTAASNTVWSGHIHKQKM